MEISSCLAALVASLLILQFLKLQWARRHFPPGPLPLPLLGTLWCFGSGWHQDTLSKVSYFQVATAGRNSGVLGSWCSDRWALEEEAWSSVCKRRLATWWISLQARELYELFPWLMRHLPGPHQKAFSCLEHIHSFGRSEIRRHKEKRETDEPRDFIDFYLDEINKKKDDPESTFDEANLVHVIYDLFTAGIDTGSSTLSWALLFMVVHPDVQEKVQAEIDAAVTRSQRISYEDRMNLPYTNAVIHEIQRYKYVLLVGNFRQCAKDATMFGFPIKKDTVIIPDIASALYDPEEWETPHQFNPNHFLDKEGNFFVRDAFIPFSIGKRFCLGENLARMEIFLFFTNLLQAFTLRLPDGVRELNTNGVRGRLAVQPYPYTICAVPRKATAWKREPEASQRA